MAKLNKPIAGNGPVAPKAPQAVKTEVRHSAIPKSAPAQTRPATPSGTRQISRDAIARRAYEIWQSGKGGSDFDNWVRAERELRGQ